MFYFQKYTRHLQRLILSPEDRQQSLSLETNPVCNAVPCFPHDNIVKKRLCDECKKSVSLNVCRMPESILWLVSQACWPTTECHVVQFVPRTSISRQFVSKLLTILQLIRVPPVWIDDNTSKDLKLCAVAPLSCLLVHPSNFRYSSRNTWFKHLLIQFSAQRLTEISPVFVERTCLPNPIQVLMKLLRIVFPIIIQLMGNRTGFVREAPWDLICVVEDISNHLNIPF